MASRLRVYKLRVDSTVIDGSTGLGYQYESIDKYSVSGGVVNVNNVAGAYDEVPGLGENSQFKLKIDDQIWDIPQHYSDERIFWYRWKIEKWSTVSSDFGSLVSTTYQTDAASSGWLPMNSYSYKCYPYVQSNDKDYGIKIYNDGDEIMIDGEYNNHIVVDEGSVSMIESAAGHWSGMEPDDITGSSWGIGTEVTVAFPTGTLANAPLIAVQPHPVHNTGGTTGSSAGDEEYNQCSKGCDWDLRGMFVFGRLVGNLSDGFTGFTYWKNFTSKYHGVRFDWKALLPATAASGEDYGFQVFNSVESVPVFDSGHTYMNIVDVITVDDSASGSQNNYSMSLYATVGAETNPFDRVDEGFHGSYYTDTDSPVISSTNAENGWFIVNELSYFTVSLYFTSSGVAPTYNRITKKAVLYVKKNTDNTTYEVGFSNVCIYVQRTSSYSGGSTPEAGSLDMMRRIPICILR